jgi:type II secretory ATPase GspE/PulE/Tfp pilus assembly ATPase PilB-like protein
VEHLSRIYHLDKADLEGVDMDQEGWDGLIDFFASNHVIPLRIDEEQVHIALFDPSDTMLLHTLEQSLGKKVAVRLCPQKEIVRFWDDFFRIEGMEDQEENIDHMIDIASEAPVVRVVSDILSRAVELSASDIHLEAKGKELRLRYRIDGILYDYPTPPTGMAPAIISRIKILSNLDIAERRVPQDGGMKLPTSSKDVDVRVSVMPTIHGEGVVLRILDKGSVNLDFEHLGLTGESWERLQSMLQKNYGMIVVAGPTGAGKTTTLYTALEQIHSASQKVITIEDPVEFKLQDVTQIQVNPKAGLTFARGLRSILRHDPDVLLVGEIRDPETASISVQAALTGHLVLSTLHANRACQVFSRLLDMGVEAFLASTAILGAMSQRLVRRLCPDCRETFAPTEAMKAEFPMPEDALLYRNGGCEACNNIGFRGRMGLFEIMPVDDRIQYLVLNRSPAGEIETSARKNGFRTMAEDGLQKSLDGLTTIEEVMRVVG